MKLNTFLVFYSCSWYSFANARSTNRTARNVLFYAKARVNGEANSLAGINSLHKSFGPLILQTLDSKVFKNRPLYQTGFGTHGHPQTAVFLRILVNDNQKAIELCQRFIRKRRMGEQTQLLLLMFETIIKNDGFSLWIRKLLKIMWQKNVLNVVVMFNNIEEHSSLVYAYLPFTEYGFRVLNMTKEKYLAERDVFQRKVTNVFGSIITVSMELEELRVIRGNEQMPMSRFYGVDGDLAELVRERLVRKSLGYRLI